MSGLAGITARVEALLATLPATVSVVAAAKTRTADEINAALAGGPLIIGQNYLQDAIATRDQVPRSAPWHFIGHLQRRKVRAVVELVDMIETVDSLRLAEEIDKRCADLGKVMPVLLEVNSGREPQKSGILPEQAESLLREIAPLPHVRVEGLMTMGPFTGDPEAARPYYRTTCQLAHHLDSLGLPGVRMHRLSMGMTNSYEVAIEEGATLIRIGTMLFGERTP